MFGEGVPNVYTVGGFPVPVDLVAAPSMPSNLSYESVETNKNPSTTPIVNGSQELIVGGF